MASPAPACLSPTLAGSAEPNRLRVANFALNGLILECRDRTPTDDALREVLQTCLRRLLLWTADVPRRPGAPAHPRHNDRTEDHGTALYRLGRFSYRRRGRVIAIWASSSSCSHRRGDARGLHQSSITIPGTEAQQALDDLKPTSRPRPARPPRSWCGRPSGGPPPRRHRHLARRRPPARGDRRRRPDQSGGQRGPPAGPDHRHVCRPPPGSPPTPRPRSTPSATRPPRSCFGWSRRAVSNPRPRSAPPRASVWSWPPRLVITFVRSWPPA